jgi:hypothetical protein
MLAAADALEFERAAMMRDEIANKRLLAPKAEEPSAPKPQRRKGKKAQRLLAEGAIDE